MHDAEPIRLSVLLHVIERLSRECLRRVRTQGSLPAEEAAFARLLNLVASGNIRLCTPDGIEKLPALLNANTRRARSVVTSWWRSWSGSSPR